LKIGWFFVGEFSVDENLDNAGLSMSAGLTFRVGQGSAERPRSLRAIRDEQTVAFEWVAGDSERVEVGEPADCLRAFLQLWDAQDDVDRVYRFIQQYGVLGLCEHFSWGPGGYPPWLVCTSCRADGAVRREHVGEYCDQATLFRSILLSLPAVTWGDVPDLAESLSERFPSMKGKTFTYQDGLVWVGLSLLFLQFQVFFARGVSPDLSVDLVSDQVQFGFSVKPTALWPALALQVVAVATSSRGVHECSICHTPYWTEKTADKRVPWRNGRRRNFCSQSCTRKARAADAREAYHKAKRQDGEAASIRLWSNVSGKASEF
jgi:hypothetical protein